MVRVTANAGEIGFADYSPDAGLAKGICPDFCPISKACIDPPPESRVF
jgi:hypothetical protein